jgi:signal transduction histidine kinase
LPVITVNRWQVVHALVNVFRNSVDAMANSQHRLLSVNASVLREHMRIVISDTGCGIPSRDLPRVFDPLFTTKGRDSSGLGLYVTKLVIEEHRGSIDIQSINGGTTVIISLPL